MELNYSALDRPEILLFLFHPRKEVGAHPTRADQLEISIPVEEGVRICGRLHIAAKHLPVILFFHGNGEIVADYDDLAPLFTGMGINFFPVDYRGYGRSNGFPTVTALLRDSHVILKDAKQQLAANGFTGPLIIMGRSLGSAPALEIAAGHPQDIDGLIIESGFAHAVPLLKRIGVDVAGLGIREDHEIGNLSKIALFDKPTLIIHAEFDHIIPFADGRELFNACPSPFKTFLKIQGADHNSIFEYGMQSYLQAIRNLLEKWM